MTKQERRRIYNLLIFSLVLLFNPNFNVVDVLPDFIAWFMLAKIFERPADSAPYFEEARASFVRLGWLNLLKIPAFFLILFVKSKDTLDNNIYALVSFTFAIFEIILVTQAIKNIFTALFYLGERADAPSLIENFSLSKNKKLTLSPEALKNLSYLFFILKTALSTIPDLFLLTGVNEKGMVVAGSKYYPYALVITLVAGIAFGIVWLKQANGYAFAIHKENKFYSALDSIAGANFSTTLAEKTRLRALLATPSLMIAAAFFSMELTFENWDNINILPHFIYGIILLFVWYSFRKHSKQKYSVLFFGIIFCGVALASYVSTVSFVSKYEYMDLTKNEAAISAYNTVAFFSTLEFVALLLLLISIARLFDSFITENTGISPDSEKYGLLEKEYHRSLKIKNYVSAALGIVAALAKCIDVFLKSEVQILFSENDVITASSLPWFGVVVTASSVIYIAYNFFFMSTLKDEIKMKYQSL